MDARVKELEAENKQLRRELSNATSTLGHYNRKVDRLIKYWRDLTGYEMLTPTIDEAIEHVMQWAAQRESADIEIEELTEQIDELKTEQEWMLGKLRQYGE
jgi:uncharacterized coiled-coil DUF342 family protein